MTASTEPRAGANSRGRRAPDFFIVGHPKCGTSALFEMLRRRPQIYMPDVKETWFFASELRRGRAGRGPGKTQATTLERYLSLFAAARADQRTGEATPSYLRSHTAATRIAEVQPAARIVAILREPASFLRSLHLQFVQTHVETEKDLRKALALEDARREGKSIPARSAQPRDLLYSDIVRYVEQLERYYAVFPPEQVLVLIYDDYRDDNAATVRKVLAHVGVDDGFPVQAVEANPSVRVRSRRLHDLVHSVSTGRDPASRIAKAGLKGLTSRRLRRQALRVTQRRMVYTEPHAPDEDLMLELRRRFKGEVAAASEYLGRDLVSLWGYDRID
jgi:Sulfotransferase family